MKALLVLFVGGLGVALLAFIANSSVLLMVSIALIVAARLGVFALGMRAAERGGYLVRYLANLAVAVTLATVGVAAIVLGANGDAPGLVLLGIVLIFSILVGPDVLEARTAHRSRG